MLKPWVPTQLLKYQRARKVLGVMCPREPNYQDYQALHREKVERLVAKAPNLEPIATYLNLPLSNLNNPKNPRAVYQDLEDQAPEWRRPVHDLIMFLKNGQKEDLQDIFEVLNLAKDKEPKEMSFQKELESLTLEEFLYLAT